LTSRGFTFYAYNKPHGHPDIFREPHILPARYAHTTRITAQRHQHAFQLLIQHHSSGALVAGQVWTEIGIRHSEI
jgi:hypothetical protein